MQPQPHAPISELYVSHDSAAKLRVEAGDLPSWDLTPRQICDLELLMNGGFNPLKGFLGQADYDSVVDTMRLADGTLWPMPITLDISQKFADTVEEGQDIALRDAEGVILAILRHRQVDPEQERRGGEGLRRRRHRAPGGELPAQPRRAGLSGRRHHRHPAARALRLPRPARHAQ